MIAARSNLRWRVAGLLSCGVLINYFDRIGLSVAGPALQQDFALSPAQLGIAFSAFFWSYCLLQLPAGLLLDRCGVARVGRWSSALWVIASGVTALASGFGGILLARLLLGIAEAPSFPGNAKAIGAWFPVAERGRSTALFDAAAKFSNVVGFPIIAVTVAHNGWRYGFGLCAVLSLGYCAAFWRLYRDPGCATHQAEQTVAPIGMLAYLLRQRKVWGLTVGFAAYGYCFYLFLTWLPAYLVQTMHLSVLQSSGWTAIPWVFATAADLLVGGWLIDHLVTKGYEATRVRKSVLITGMCLGLAVFGATATHDPVIAIVWISIALSGLSAAAPVGWSLPALIAPRGGTGTVASIMNFANNLAGVAAPIITGLIVGRTHSFAGAFLIAGVTLVVGVVAFVGLLGRIEPLRGPEASGALSAAGA